MMKNKKNLVVIFCLVSLFVLLPTILKKSNFTYTKSIDLLNLRSSGYPHFDPFIIDDNGGGNFTWAEAVLQPWCSGSGTEGDPYIIEEIFVDGRDETSCIEIWNSTAYVKIQNCSVTKAAYFGNMKYAGIKLKNTCNVQLIENDIYYNYGHAIVLYNSNNTILSDNEIRHSGEDWFSYHNAIVFYNSHNSLITENIVYYNAYDGFHITKCENITFIDNNISTNGYYGVELISCKNFIITETEMRGNWLGIGLFNSSYNNISQNFIDSIDVGISCEESSNNNTILGNTVESSASGELELIDSIGIWLISCDGNNIQQNDISDEFEAGLFCYLSDYNTIVKNSISDSTIYGIGLRESNYNNVSRNILTDNEICIEEISCVGNIIEDNICRESGGSISGFSLPLLILFVSLSTSTLLLVKIRRRKQN